jgi:hypothetical protein
MVFDMNSEPFVGRIETGAFRDRPALERAVELEPEVVMQTGRVVLLDQIAQLACPRLADPSAFGLLGLREVALGMIAIERRSFCGFGRHGDYGWPGAPGRAVIRAADVGSFARIRSGDRATHAAISAGDQGPASTQPAGAFVAVLAMVGFRLHFADESRPGLRLALERQLGTFADWSLHVLNRLIGPEGVEPETVTMHLSKFGIREIGDVLRGLEFRVALHDALFPGDGGRLVLAGVTDLSASRSGYPTPDLAAALRGAPRDVAVILLDHQPREARRAAALGVALQLSGHTHGGMVLGLDRLAARANSGYVSGRYDVDGMTLYVNNGTGCGPASRFGSVVRLS